MTRYDAISYLCKRYGVDTAIASQTLTIIEDKWLLYPSDPEWLNHDYSNIAEVCSYLDSKGGE